MLLFTPKDLILDLQRSDGLYKISHAIVRMDTAFERTQRAVNLSDLAEHVWTAGHSIDWHNVTILTNCPEYYSSSV